MCGIFAYINQGVPQERKQIIEMLINGLKRLEYRGYDSAGMAIDGDKELSDGTCECLLVKRSGKVKELEKSAHSQPLDYDKLMLSHIGIAHTRWATHGPPTEVNCHPHRSDATNEFAVIHNGIITNCRDLRILLESKGYAFESETDTETVAKLIKYMSDTMGYKATFRQLVEATVARLEGAFALIFKSRLFPGQAVATRRGSPLLIGVRVDEVNRRTSIPIMVDTPPCSPPSLRKNLGRHEGLHRSPSWENVLPQQDTKAEFFLASDASAIVEHTRRVLYLEDDDVALIDFGSLAIHRISHTSVNERPIMTLDYDMQEIMKGKFAHFMLKEIFEQPESVVNTMRGRVDFKNRSIRLGGVMDYVDVIRRARRLVFVACGTSFNAALAVRSFLEEASELPVIVDIASDFLDRACPLFRDDVCVFVSQSGETADTLSALRYCKSRGALLVGITNSVGSTISRETQCGIHINAGPEIGVASTKAYTSQIVSLVMFGSMLAQDRVSMQPRLESIIDDLSRLSDSIREVLDLDSQIRRYAEELYKETSLLVMGRGPSFANCLEGALKIKELTYMHSEAIAAGELKHGPLALVDSTMPIIMIIMRDRTFGKSQNALEQIVARGGRPIVICPKGERPSAAGIDLRTIEVPQLVDCLQNVITVLPLQMLSYHLACLRGHDVDCPRNLAKSVTVE